MDTDARAGPAAADLNGTEADGGPRPDGGSEMEGRSEMGGGSETVGDRARREPRARIPDELARIADELGRIEIGLRAGRYREALDALDALAADGPPRRHRDMYAILRARTLFRLGRLGDARHTLNGVTPERVPEGLDLLLRRSEQVRSGNGDVLETAARLAERTQAPADLDHAARLHLRGGEHEQAERLARRAMERAPDRPGPYVTLLAALDHSADTARLADVVREAVARASPFPAFAPAMLVFLLTSLPRGEASALAEAMLTRSEVAASVFADTIRSFALTGSHSERMAAGPLHPIMEHALAGRVDEARALTNATRGAGTPEGPGMRTTRRILSALPREGDLRRPLVRDEGAAVTASEPSRSGTTVLVCLGFRGLLGAGVRLIDTFCAATGTAAIYVRDPSYRFFLNGIPGLGTNDVSTAEALRNRLDALGTRRLVMLGPSAGGMPAIRYGLMLQADAIVALSTPTTGLPRTLKAIGDPRSAVIAERLRCEFGSERIDVMPDLEERSHTVREGIHLWFGADNRIDAAHAVRVSHCRGVHLHPMAGCAHHAILADLIGDGTLRRLLDPGGLDWLRQAQSADVAGPDPSPPAI